MRISKTRVKLFVATLPLLFSIDLGKAQVVFCPPGARWNYTFVNIPAWGGIYNFINESISYSKDSILNGESVKVLDHRFYYETCYNVGGGKTKRTCIKQKGDTVFFRNA